ncbi:lipopolysaccharide biosynthesis protein [Sphingobium sp. H39-3-25]|uniref:lipopolysaccharide biosynthesis protein n=1 Tax=Sphingobium arseniciresistens TaxID=3030834 RepID=UPI0023B8B8EB|nr:lipopolysaccharide biosynthesis protein [Sphingobium arseniciresistens]
MAGDRQPPSRTGDGPQAEPASVEAADAQGGGGGEANAAFSRILRNTGWLLGGKGIGGILSLFYLAIVTRTLGVADFGRFALILSTAQAINTFVSFESWQIVVRYGQTHLMGTDRNALNRLIRFCILIDLGGAALGCLIAGAVALFLGPHFGWSPGISRSAFIFCAIMLITIRSTPTGILRLFDRFDAGALAETMIPIGRMIGAIVVLLTSPSIIAFLIAWGAAELACAATYWTLALRAGRGQIGSWRGGSLRSARTENPGLMGFLTATNLTTTMSAGARQAAVLVVGLFAGPMGAGYYRLANQLSQSMTKISGQLSRSIFVELARVNASEDRSQLRAVFRRTNRLALIGGATTVALILLAGKPIITLMSGPAFLGAYPLLVLLGIGASIDLIGVSYTPLLMATGRASTALRITIATSLLLLGLLVLLMPRYGTIGAASASCIAASVGFGLMLWTSRRALSSER